MRIWTVGFLFSGLGLLAGSACAQEDLRRFKVEALPAVILDAPQPDPVIRAIGDPAWDGTLPSTFVFDARGRLVKSFIGRTDAKSLAAAVAAATAAPTVRK